MALFCLLNCKTPWQFMVMVSFSCLQIVFFIASYKLIYKFFNLDFFSIEALSFCLWKGATVLDVLAFKYVTVIGGLALMFLCVILVNSTQAKKCFSHLRVTTLKSSLIHGLSVFFVLCYSQCASVCSGILKPVVLTTKYNAYIKTVVFRSGSLTVFDLTHLPYALSAIDCDSSITATCVSCVPTARKMSGSLQLK